MGDDDDDGSGRRLFTRRPSPFSNVVVAEGPVPLSRLVPAGIDKRGETTRARVVLFRRPLERRAKHPEDLEDLLFEVLVEQVATYLGMDPDEIDPASAEQ